MTDRRTHSTTYPDLIDYTNHLLATADQDDWEAHSRDLIEDLRDEVLRHRLAQEATSETVNAAVAAADSDSVALDAISGVQHAFTVLVTRTQVRPTLIVAADERTAIAGAVAFHENEDSSGWDDHEPTFGADGTWIEETFKPGDDPSTVTNLNAVDVLAATKDPS